MVNLAVGKERDEQVALDIMRESKDGPITSEHIRTFEMSRDISPLEYLPMSTAHDIASAYSDDKKIDTGEFLRILVRHPSNRVFSMVSLLRNPAIRLRSMGIGVTDMDINGDGKAETAEAVIYMLKNLKPEYKPILKSLGIKHPNDTWDYPPEIKDRINEIASKIKSEISMDEKDPGFCDAFVPRFVEEGKKSFADGGLCLGYTEQRTKTLLEEPEMTSSEAFSVCMDPDETYGSCSEKTFIIKGAMQLATSQCDINSVVTENHLFPSYGGKSLDPSEIGEIGWSREIDPLATYFYNKSIEDPNNPLYSRIAVLLEPGTSTDFHSIKNKFDAIYKSLKSAPLPSSSDIKAFLEEFDTVISSTPKFIGPFNTLIGYIAKLPPSIGYVLGSMAVERWPESPYALRPLIAALSIHPEAQKAAKGDPKARAAYEKIVNDKADFLRTKFPSKGFAETLLAPMEHMFGNIAKAETLVKQALDTNPNNAYALSYLADFAMRDGKFEKAKKFLNQAISIAPNLENQHYRLAMIAQARGDIKLASLEAKKESTVFFNNAQAIVLASDLEIMRGQPIKSLEILSLYPAPLSNPVFGQKFAYAYQTMGAFKFARVILEKLIKENPQDVYLHTSMTQLCLEQYDLTCSDKHLAQSPDSVFKRLLQISRSLVVNDVSEAERQFSVLKATPGIESSMIELAEAFLYGAKGDLTEARRRYDIISKKLPHDYSSKTMLIANDIEMGRVAKARAAYKKLVEEFPYLFAVRQLEPMLLIREEKHSQALASAERLLRMNPTDANLLSTKGHALNKIGRTREAFNIGKLLSTKHPTLPGGMILMARALLKMGRAKEALKLIPKIEAIQVYDPTWWPLMSSSALEKDVDKALD